MVIPSRRFLPNGLRLSANSPFAMQAPSGQVGPAWEFEIGNIEPGRIALAFDAMPSGWAIKRITANDRDVTESLLDLSSGGTPVNVEIPLDRQADVAVRHGPPGITVHARRGLHRRGVSRRPSCLA